MKIYKIKDRKKFNNAIWKLSNKVGSKCLAEKIGVCQSCINHWSNGNRVASKSIYIERLINVFNLTLEDLGSECIETNTSFSFGSTLKHLLETNNVKQEELAIDISVDESLISKYINNKSQPSINNLIKIANYFDVSLDYLLTGETYEDNINALGFSKKAIKKCKDYNKSNLDSKEYISKIDILNYMLSESNLIDEIYTLTSYIMPILINYRANSQYRNQYTELVHKKKYTLYNDIDKSVRQMIRKCINKKIKEISKYTNKYNIKFLP